MTAQTTTTSRGEARRRAFLDAALEVFLKHGLGAASVNDVVRMAGGSLATLYAQFGSKEGLFVAMFAERVETLVEPLQQIGSSHLPLKEGLQEIGVRFLTAVLRPQSAALYRIVLAEGMNYPDLAAQFQAVGPERVRAAVKGYLDERRQAGEVREGFDTDWGATYFIELLRARHVFSSMTVPNYDPPHEEIEASVTRAIDAFVNGATPR